MAIKEGSEVNIREPRRMGIEWFPQKGIVVTVFKDSETEGCYLVRGEGIKKSLPFTEKEIEEIIEEG